MLRNDDPTIKSILLTVRKRKVRQDKIRYEQLIMSFDLTQ